MKSAKMAISGEMAAKSLAKSIENNNGENNENNGEKRRIE
jgi:hypothetical protein